MKSNTEVLTLDDDPTVVARPDTRHYVLDHIFAYNPNETAVYLVLRDTLTDESAAGPVRRVIPIGPGFSGTIVIGMAFTRAVMTCGTNADGTGDPGSAVLASDAWEVA